MNRYRRAFGRYLKDLRQMKGLSQADLEEKLIKRCQSSLPPGTYSNPSNFPVKIISLFETGARCPGKVRHMPIIRELDNLLDAKGNLIKAYTDTSTLETQYFQEHTDLGPDTRQTDADEDFDWIALVTTMLTWDKMKYTFRERAVRSIAALLRENHVPFEPENVQLREFVNHAFNLMVLHEPKNIALLEKENLKKSKSQPTTTPPCSLPTLSETGTEKTSLASLMPISSQKSSMFTQSSSSSPMNMPTMQWTIVIPSTEDASNPNPTHTNVTGEAL